MNDITLSKILGLVGKLDDTPGENTPRERFRRFLNENIKEVGQIRDYIEECLRNKGDQYNRALQDLVNLIGSFLGFEVTYGRYQGKSGEIGFDGHWKSPTGFHIVVEVKTTEVYSVKTATLIGYVDQLISDKKIPNWESAMGLYIIGRPDPELKQLRNAIIAEKRYGQLRIISVEALLTLAEMKSEYGISHEDILAIMRPSGPTIDPIIDLMNRLVVEKEVQVEPETEIMKKGSVCYWITPVKGENNTSAEEVIKRLVGEEGIYAFGERTPGRKEIKPGDWICFYAAGVGVVAHARVKSKPKRKPHKKIQHPERYPWTFELEETKLYAKDPVILDVNLRRKLDAFKNRDPEKYWAWFVQATRKVSKHDFMVLTRQLED